MKTFSGTHHVERLIPLDLPFETTVQVLMDELSLTHEEAASSILDARSLSGT